MMNVVKVMAASVLVLGCGSKPATPTTTTEPMPSNKVEPVSDEQVLAGLRDEVCACTDAACARTVDGRYATWREQRAEVVTGEDDAVPPQLAAHEDEYHACRQTLMPTSRLPPECDEYRVGIQRLIACDKVPQATRDALAQSLEQTAAAWAAVPAEGQAALAQACRAAADAVRQSASACDSGTTTP